MTSATTSPSVWPFELLGTWDGRCETCHVTAAQPDFRIHTVRDAAQRITHWCPNCYNKAIIASVGPSEQRTINFDDPADIDRSFVDDIRHGIAVKEASILGLAGYPPGVVTLRQKQAFWLRQGMNPPRSRAERASLERYRRIADAFRYLREAEEGDAYTSVVDPWSET